MISVKIMGRWSYSYRQEADYAKKIDMPWLKKYGYLKFPGKSGGIEWTHGSGEKSSVGISSVISETENYLRIFYTQTDISTGEKRNFDYKAYLTTTPCNYGGKRYWFICPLSANKIPCLRRVGTLYKVGDYFGCRHCHDLTYSCRNENRKYKNYYLFRTLELSSKAIQIGEGMKRSFYNGKPTRKMKRIIGMHRRMQPYAALLESDKEL